MKLYSVRTPDLELDLIMHKPYSIRTPEWETASGGIRVMYGLYGALLLKGQIAFLNAQIGVPFVGIYPEVFHGNDLNAEKVVRYILQKPGMMRTYGVEGPTEFDPTDELFVFSRLFYRVPEDHYMFLPIIDTHLFKDQKRKRTKTYYYVGKGTNLAKHPWNADEWPRIQDQQEIADLMNECQVLYIYDPVTALSEIARLCNTRVVMFNPMEGFEKLYEPGMNGISIGSDTGVKLDYNEFRGHYAKMKEDFLDKLDFFIDRTQR